MAGNDKNCKENPECEATEPLAGGAQPLDQAPGNPHACGSFSNAHDLRLSSWGPYTKRYIGISHVADSAQGLRFDLSVFPGYYRRAINVPNVMFECGYHPWEAVPDLSYFRHRHELEWKDRVFADISFSRIDENACVIRSELVNNTSVPQNLALHCLASFHFPTAIHDKTFAPLIPYRPVLPAGAIWMDGMDYTEMSLARPEPTDLLRPDGLKRGEVRGNGFVGNSGLGGGFGKDAGDRVTYTFHLGVPVPAACLIVRYRCPGPFAARFSLRGVKKEKAAFEPTREFSLKVIPAGDLAPGEHQICLESLGGAGLEVDGLVLVRETEIRGVDFAPVERDPVPERMVDAEPAGLMLKYRALDHWYGVAWDFDRPARTREILNSEIDVFLRTRTHDHVSTRLEGDGKGHYANISLAPVFLEPRAARVVHGLVCQGSAETVREKLRGFSEKRVDCEATYRRSQARANAGPVNPSGKSYVFSQKLMKATTLTNVVYPIYCRGGYIRHNTPGRWWDCLYTWDSGFIGLGLLECDLERAIDCLNAYLTEPDDSHGAFIHHGSPVPVQIHLAMEIWNRTQDREILEKVYPRLRQYHRFLAGRGPSTTGRLKSNLLVTWDYFYNSGGWDDYPPQLHVHQQRLTASVAPVANTAHAIRTARILRLFAAEGLGVSDDVGEYDEDIAVLSAALQEHAYDEESGYFGYVCHDEIGTPRSILRHESGVNFNMGLDGAYPLVAGICTSRQEKRLIRYLESDKHLWSRSGVSTVDQSAPYFRPDGYWNGAVWMPHQWFFWKTLLDLGYGQLASRIALRALELWNDEVNESYNCFEHFLVHSGRGAGWHQFGGLSCPVLSWFGAYHRPGRLTTGCDTWVGSRNFSDNQSRLEADLKIGGAREGTTAAIAVMNPDFVYQADWNGAVAACTSLFPGTCLIEIPRSVPAGRLTITAEKTHRS